MLCAGLLTPHERPDRRSPSRTSYMAHHGAAALFLNHKTHKEHAPMMKRVFVYFVSVVVIRNLRTLYQSFSCDLLRVLRASVVKNPDYRRYAPSILPLHKLSQNHSHFRGSTNIGARNACAHAVSKFSTIHRHTTYANRSPNNQNPIIENPREPRAFWDTIPRLTSKTHPHRPFSPTDDPPWWKLTNARRINIRGDRLANFNSGQTFTFQLYRSLTRSSALVL